MTVERKTWGTMPDGSEVELFTLVNDCGMRASIATYGATLVELSVPDRDGVFADVVLGFDDLTGYLNDTHYVGCMVGRTAGRMGNASFELDGTVWELDRNNVNHHIHGGGKGFHSRLWTANPMETVDGPALTLSYVSEDGEEGYPGRLELSVVYTLMKTRLRLTCEGRSDKLTVVNVTNHSYFNLGGHDSGDVLEQELCLSASRYLECDTEQIPSGVILDVTGTPLDFSRSRKIGERIDDPADTMQRCQGYDHYLLVDGEPGGLNMAARVFHEESGRQMELHTTAPGVQFYTANHVSEQVDGKTGGVYGRYSGLCLEAQGYPDAPNHLNFPSVVIRPGELYEQTTEFRFLIK